MGVQKKYKINSNMTFYNIKTRMYENTNGQYKTYAEAKQTQWKCEKCNETFPTYKMLRDHKTESHSY